MAGSSGVDCFRPRSRRSRQSTFGAPIEGGSNLSRDGINCLGIQDWLSEW